MLPIDIRKTFLPLFTDGTGHYANVMNGKIIQTIHEHKLFKCFLPADVGGLGMNIMETLQVIEDCSYVNGSLGWLIQIGNGGNYFAEYFDEKTYRKLFSPKDAVIAGSGAPSGKAVPAENGLRLSGEWRYASGSDYATIFTTSFIDTDGTTVRSCAVMRNQVEIINDWKTSGLKNSSTNSFRIKDAFVPQEQVFVLTTRKQTLPSDAFRFPFLSYAQLFFIKVITGITIRMNEEVEKFTAPLKAKWAKDSPGRFESIMAIIDDNRSLITETDSLITQLVNAPDKNDTKLNEYFDKEICAFNLKFRNNAHELFRLCGMPVLFEDHPVNILYNDLLCTSQHKLVNKFN